MVNVYPGYFKSFKCIADKCKNNCCIGWEIDIDKESYQRYMNTGGELGKKLKANISHGDEPCFILGENERCPFLNSSNLCEIILEKGEDALCGICRDHPRFRNFFEGVTETGIGLACEEAAGIIISDGSGTVFDADGDITEDEEYYAYYSFRKRIFDIISNKELCLEERIGNIRSIFKFKAGRVPLSVIGKLLLSLEILNPDWKTVAEKLRESEGFVEAEFGDEDICERLICYFIFRHMADGYFSGEVIESILFAILSTRIINCICNLCGISYETAARMYSSEIEYSAENTEALMRLAEEYYEIY